MLSGEDIKKLANLARINIAEEEMQSLSNEMGAILGYVGEIKSVSASAKHLEVSLGENINALREDENPHESGIHTEVLLSSAPQREEDYVKVKKIL